MSNIDPKEYLDELRLNIKKKDIVKINAVLDYLSDVDFATQEITIAELEKLDADIAGPTLAFIVGRNPNILEIIPNLMPVFNMKLVEYPPALIEIFNDKRIKDKEPFIELAAEMELKEATAALVDYLNQEPSLQSAKRAIEALGRIGDLSTVSVLSEYLYSNDRELTLAAVKALGDIGNNVSIQRLAERMGSDTGLDVFILNIFAKIQNPLSLEKLNATLGSHHDYLRNYAKTKLADIGPKTVPILVTNLTLEDPDVLVHTLNVLGDIGDESVVKPVKKLLRNEPEDPNVRFAAYEVLGRIPVKEGVYTLVKGILDEIDFVAVAATKAIDSNFNDVAKAGLQNLIKQEKEDLERYVEIIIISESKKIFLSLVEDKVFMRHSIKYLKNNTPDNVKQIFERFLRNNNCPEQADAILETIKRKTDKKEVSVWAVDDSRMMLKIYQNTLHNLNCDSKLFEFPADLLEEMKKESPNILITDLNMPDISGIELTRRVRKRFSKKELPIIMITTQTDSVSNREIEKAGVTKVLLKPFTKDELSGALKDLL